MKRSVEQLSVSSVVLNLGMPVKPGLTRLAQVVGRYSATVERKLHFDLLYIYNYSLLLDLKILLQTIRVVLQREQAAGLTLKTPSGRPAEHLKGIARVDDAMEQASSSND